MSGQGSMRNSHGESTHIRKKRMNVSLEGMLASKKKNEPKNPQHWNIQSPSQGSLKKKSNWRRSKTDDDDDDDNVSITSRTVMTFMTNNTFIRRMNRQGIWRYSILSILLLLVWITLLSSTPSRNDAHKLLMQHQQHQQQLQQHRLPQSRKEFKQYFNKLQLNHQKTKFFAGEENEDIDIMDKAYLLQPPPTQQHQQEKKNLRQSFKESGILVQYDSNIPIPKNKQGFTQLLQSLREDYQQNNQDNQNNNNQNNIDSNEPPPNQQKQQVAIITEEQPANVISSLPDQNDNNNNHNDDDAWALERPAAQISHTDVISNKPPNDMTEPVISNVNNVIDNNQNQIQESHTQSIAYVLPIKSCPDAPDAPHNINPHGSFNKPRLAKEGESHDLAFADIAAVTLHSIKQIHSQSSKYTNFQVYAIIASNAVTCTSEVPHHPNTASDNKLITVNRQQVLENLGFQVIIVDPPVQLNQIQGSYLRKNLAQNVGISETIRLHAYTLIQHDVVVLLDRTTLLLKPLDDVYDALLQPSKEQMKVQTMYNTQIPQNIQAFFSRDLSSVTPQKWHSGYDMNLFIFKPSMQVYNELVTLLKEGNYDAQNGWGGVEGFGNYHGSMGTKGLLTFYYEHLNPLTSVQLHKCIYTNRNENPFIRLDGSTTKCRDQHPTCADCRTTPLQEIVAANISVCRYPWICFHHPKHPNYELCREFTRKWYEYRQQIDTNTQQIGQFYPTVTKGYCDAGGEAGYRPMINLLQ